MISISISDVTTIFPKLKPRPFMHLFSCEAAYELYRVKNLEFPGHKMTLNYPLVFLFPILIQ